MGVSTCVYYQNTMRFKSLCSLVILLAGALPARAQGLSVETVPGKWIEELLPETDTPPDYRAYFDELDKARAQLLAGQYRRALHALADFDRGAATRPASEERLALATSIRAECLWMTGRATTALEVLAQVKIETVYLDILRARILADNARLADARALLAATVTKFPTSIEARYWLGQSEELAGDLDAAREAYEWFVQQPHDFLSRWREKPESFESASEVTSLGRSLDAWARLTAAYQKDPALRETILSMFVRAYDVIDRTHWPAHLAAAEYFLFHGDMEEAGKEIAEVQDANPNDPALQNLIGRIYLANLKFDGVEQALASLRRLNSESNQADLLEVRLLNRLRNSARAEKLANQVLDRDPYHLEALGLLAAARLRGVTDDESAEIFRRIESIDPDNASAYFEVAEQYSDLRQSPRAIDAYKTAIERAPWWVAPRNGLGEVYTRTSDEDLARLALEEAYALDPFNVKTVNYLRVLDEMATFEKLETPHFIFQFAPADAVVVRHYIAPYMEEIYDEVCRDFQHEPPVKTVIEMFPDKETFSVRTAGLTGAETFGASFGPIVTSVAPRAGRTLGPYNFARVLRHEFTHVMNMSATEQRCPRWLTEGMAVWQEKVEYRFAWLPPVLYRKAIDGTLFPITQLDKALMHPPRPMDGEVAYMESFWFVLFLRERFGENSIVDLLAAYKSGLGDADAIAKITGRNVDDVQIDFFEWCKAKVSTWGYDKETAEKFKELTGKAEELTKARLDEEAIAVWQEASILQPLSLLPHRRLAGLFIRLKKPAQAVPHMEKLLPIELQDNRYAKRLARLARDSGGNEQAIDFAMRAMHIDPYDVDGHQLLAELYRMTGDKEKVAREEEVIATLKASGIVQTTKPAE